LHFFSTMSDASLTVMLYWFAILLPPQPSQCVVRYNNNVIES
jgi:hypothetical protein